MPIYDESREKVGDEISKKGTVERGDGGTSERGTELLGQTAIFSDFSA